jgi:hypothetical protein
MDRTSHDLQGDTVTLMNKNTLLFEALSANSAICFISWTVRRVGLGATVMALSIEFSE